MTGNQERARELRGLLIDMNADVKALARLYDTVTAEQAACLTDATKDEILIWGLAAWLHHIYTGVESLLSRVAQVLDGYTTRAEDWHRRLLVTMSDPLENVRPAVLSPKTFAWLNELRRFRHLFRNAYGAEMDSMRVKTLVLKALSMRSALDHDLDQIRKFVEQLIACHQKPDDTC
jgi:hypothetical protein